MNVVPKVVNLASKSTSGSTWSPVQLLREFLDAVESGKEKPIMLSVNWMEETTDGGWRPRFWQAGCSRAEQIAFLEVMKQSLLDDWRK